MKPSKRLFLVSCMILIASAYTCLFGSWKQKPCNPIKQPFPIYTLAGEEQTFKPVLIDGIMKRETETEIQIYSIKLINTAKK